MNKAIFNGLGIALIGALMGFAAPVSTAQAGNSHNWNNGSGKIITERRGERNHDGFGRDLRGGKHQYHRKHRRHSSRNICSPREAVHKVRGLGLRRAEIKRINNRVIVVSGKKRGKRIVVGMERRSRHCDIAFVRGTHRGHKNRGFRY